SQFQTPTGPRRAVGFFGSGCPTGCPAKLITQSTSDWLILFEPILSIVDAGNHSPRVGRCQRPFLVQCTPLVAGLLRVRRDCKIHHRAAVGRASDYNGAHEGAAL